MKNPAQLSRIDRLLSDSSGAPWATPPAGLRARTIAALADGRPQNKAGCKLHSGAMAGFVAACIALAGGWLFIALRPDPKPVTITAMPDPSPLVTPALRLLAFSAEDSMASEARQFLDDTSKITRKVIAQLPFVGSGG